jgi:hypothetical protein
VAFDALVSEIASNDFPLEDIQVPTLLIHAAETAGRPTNASRRRRPAFPAPDW